MTNCNKIHVVIFSVASILLIAGLVLWADGAVNNVDDGCCKMATEKCRASFRVCTCTCTAGEWGDSGDDESIECTTASVNFPTTSCSNVPHCKTCVNRQMGDHTHSLQAQCSGGWEKDCMECAPGYYLVITKPIDGILCDVDFKGVGYCVKEGTKEQDDGSVYQRLLEELQDSGEGHSCTQCNSYKTQCDNRWVQIIVGVVCVLAGLIVS